MTWFLLSPYRDSLSRLKLKPMDVAIWGKTAQLLSMLFPVMWINGEFQLYCINSEVSYIKKENVAALVPIHPE